jgi:hypothetical protein
MTYLNTITFSSAVERAQYGLHSSPSMTQLDDTNLGSSHSSLIEVFPSTYQTLCQPFLILDKAAYLFMQFVNIGRTMAINHTAVKAFLRWLGFMGVFLFLYFRRCKLTDVISNREVDVHFIDLHKKYTANNPFYSGNHYYY